jgi:hypothetical protein
VKTLGLTLLFCASMWGQDLAVVMHDPTNTVPDSSLSSLYLFADTPVGNAGSIVLRFANASAATVQIEAILVDTGSSMSPASPHFTVTGAGIGKTLGTGPAASFQDATVSFTPQATGLLTGYLLATYQIQQGGCSFTSTTPATQCPTKTALISTLTGRGTAAQFALTTSATGQAALQADSSSPLNFGNVSTSATAMITFTLANASSVALASPAVSLQTQVFGSSAFVLDKSALPATIAANSLGFFTITFAPGQTGQANATLLIGSAVYPISGTGIVVGGFDALQIQCVDATGVRTLPEAATPIDFGQVIAGTNTPAILTFTVTNPLTSFDAVSLSPLAATGSGFALAAAPVIPASIAPGGFITFQVVFSPPKTGKYTGLLTIGNRNFALTGSSITSAVPGVMLQVTPQPLTSQLQASLTIQLASASTIDAIGTLSMTFLPDVAGVTDDPAIFFLATSGRKLQVNATTGLPGVTYNGQPALTFQTGTTAGTLTFTVTFPNQAPTTQSFTIAPAQVSIASGTAVRQAPNLVVTLTGFDNTYSAGAMTFTFLDASGNALTAAPMTVDATSAFHQYFFGDSKAGGAFSVQASFPVTGSVTQVGSVRIGLNNSAGTSTVSESFQ